MKHWIVLTPDTLRIDGVERPLTGERTARLAELYRSAIGDYPKFFKMDDLCKAGFVAAELLLKAECPGDVTDRPAYNTDHRAVLLFNCSSSLSADTKYQATIQQADNYFPSPSIFVYTLPNIVTGEIAIRNKYYGETNFIILQHPDGETIARQVENLFLDETTSSALTGWVDCPDELHYEVRLAIIERGENITEAINQLLK